jgi:hypothetical protein
MAINDICQARIVGTLHGQTTINQLCYVLRDPNTTPMDIATNVAGDIVNFLLLATSVEYTCQQVDAQIIDPPPRTFVATYQVGSAGSKAGGSAPSSVAVVLRKRTQFAGRKFRGRWYFPGIPTSDIQLSQISGGATIDWNKLGTALLQGIGAIGQIPATPVLYAPRKGYAPQPQPLTAVVLDQVLRNQRRRQIGRGI